MVISFLKKHRFWFGFQRSVGVLGIEEIDQWFWLCDVPCVGEHWKQHYGN